MKVNCINDSFNTIITFANLWSWNINGRTGLRDYQDDQDS